MEQCVWHILDVAYFEIIYDDAQQTNENVIIHVDFNIESSFKKLEENERCWKLQKMKMVNIYFLLVIYVQLTA